MKSIFSLVFSCLAFLSFSQNIIEWDGNYKLQAELNARLSKASLETDLGRNKLKLTELHREVLLEIGQFSDFCKECKPPKKRNH